MSNLDEPNFPQTPQVPTSAAAPSSPQNPQYGPYLPSENPPASLESSPSQHSRRSLPWALLVVVLLLSLLSGASGAALVLALNHSQEQPSAVGPLSAQPSSAPSEKLSRIAAALAPSVVSVETLGSNATSTGSGMVFSADGLILTNNHVIELAASDPQAVITVKLHDGTAAKASIKGRDEASDLAILKTDLKGLTPVKFAPMSQVNVGDQVLAIGSPLGLEGSVSSGIISALGRTVVLGETSDPASPALVSDALQTDAAINPGNSGGPLVDMSGEVVGVNTAIASLNQSGQATSIGLGFAINSDQALRIAQSLADGKRPQRALLGVSVSSSLDPQGAKVEKLNTVSASQGLLEPGDVIVKMDGELTPTPEDLTAKVRAHQPGDDIVLEVVRQGRTLKLNITLGGKNES